MHLQNQIAYFCLPIMFLNLETKKKSMKGPQLYMETSTCVAIYFTIYILKHMVMITSGPPHFDQSY